MSLVLARRVLAVVALMGVAIGCLPTQHARAGTDTPPPPSAVETAQPGARILLPAVHDETDGVVIDVSIDANAALAMEKTSYWVVLTAGAASVPMSVLNPIYGLGVVYTLVGPPMNAVFNARRETIIKAIASEPLPSGILQALKRRLQRKSHPGPLHIDIRVASYGLKTRTGESLSLIDHDKELCLVADASLTLTRPDREPVRGKARVDVLDASIEAPPPVCASMGDFARDDGLYLRQSIRELSEVIAGLALMHLDDVHD